MAGDRFLVFPSRDDEGRHVLKISGDGIVERQKLLTVDDCLHYVKVFTEAAREIRQAEREKDAAR
jgi:hypothetical protein